MRAALNDSSYWRFLLTCTVQPHCVGEASGAGSASVPFSSRPGTLTSLFARGSSSLPSSRAPFICVRTAINLSATLAGTWLLDRKSGAHPFHWWYEHNFPGRVHTRLLAAPTFAASCGRELHCDTNVGTCVSPCKRRLFSSMAAMSASFTMSPADGARPCAILKDVCHLRRGQQ